MLKLVS